MRYGLERLYCAHDWVPMVQPVTLTYKYHYCPKCRLKEVRFPKANSVKENKQST